MSNQTDLFFVTGDLIISYNGQTLRCPNATITRVPQFRPPVRQVDSFTSEELEEAIRLFDAIFAKYPGDRYKAFMNDHPKGGSFFLLPDGSVGFVDAPTLQPGVIVTATPRQIAKLHAPTATLHSK